MELNIDLDSDHRLTSLILTMNSESTTRGRYE
jgi:hypothetical protein